MGLFGYLIVLSIVAVLTWQTLPPITEFARAIPVGAWLPIQVFIIWPSGLLTVIVSAFFYLIALPPSEAEDEILNATSLLGATLGALMLVGWGVLGWLGLLVLLFAEP